MEEDIKYVIANRQVLEQLRKRTASSYDYAKAIRTLTDILMKKYVHLSYDNPVLKLIYLIAKVFSKEILTNEENELWQKFIDNDQIPYIEQTLIRF